MIFRKLILTGTCCLIAASVMAQGGKKSSTAKPKQTKVADLKPVELSKADKFSYAVGFNIATGMKMQKIDVNPDILATAMKAVLNGTPGLMDENEGRTRCSRWRSRRK